MISKVMSSLYTRITLLWHLMQCRLVQLYQRIREFRSQQRHGRDLLEHALSHCTSLYPRGQRSTSYKTSLSLASLLSINIIFEKFPVNGKYFNTFYTSNITIFTGTLSVFRIFRNKHYVSESVFFRPQTTDADNFGNIVFVFIIA
jgi:hypothetical protein